MDSKIIWEGYDAINTHKVRVVLIGVGVDGCKGTLVPEYREGRDAAGGPIWKSFPADNALDAARVLATAVYHAAMAAKPE